MAGQEIGGIEGSFLPADAPNLLHRFARFWEQKRGDLIVPNFADLDPVDMPWALQSVFVVERLPNLNLAYRLVGGQMSDRLGGRLIGKTAAEVFETEYAGHVNTRWLRVLEEPALCYAVTRHLTREGQILQARRFLAPARSVSGEIDRVIGVSAFDQAHFEAGSGIDGGTEIDVRWWPLTENSTGSP
jgi:hypothetical protein